jgi:hypothetical protein
MTLFEFETSSLTVMSEPRVREKAENTDESGDAARAASVFALRKHP